MSGENDRNPDFQFLPFAISIVEVKIRTFNSIGWSKDVAETLWTFPNYRRLTGNFREVWKYFDQFDRFVNLTKI